jgi:hypothetical protein
MITPLSASSAAELVRGAIELEPTAAGVQPHRMPAWARAQGDGQLAMVETQPSGVRLVFRTSATSIELDTIRTTVTYVGMPGRPEGVYDLVVNGVLVDQQSGTGGHVLEIDMATGGFEHRPGPVGTVRFAPLADGVKDVEIWLPWNESTELVELRTDAPVEPLPDNGRRVWLHHGSSISHGSVADRPTGTWPAVAARLAGVDLVNLGFGGSAMLDPFVARAIRDIPADQISLKLGINVVNQDLLRRRALAPAVHGYLDTIRDGHPDTPIRLISPVHCAIHESTPGPTAPDMAALAEGRMAFVAAGDPGDVARGSLTLEVVREVLADVVDRRGDPHLTYVDGLALYGAADAERLPLPDNLHPDSAAHRLIGERFAGSGDW